jgi:hypothetical protein
MRADWKDTIVLISSRDAKNSSRFGTGFVIHQTDDAAYVVTCAHVVNDVGPDAAQVNGQAAAVVAIDEGFDLAVLKVTSAADLPDALPLSATARTGMTFSVAGFYRPDKRADQCQQLDGVLEKEDARWSATWKSSVPAWWVKIDGDEYGLQPGHSGGPVIEQASGKVIGVIAIREGAGQKGIAISIAALSQIWREMPAGLFAPPPRPPLSRAAAAKPIINLEEELPAFEKMLSGEDADTRLILVHGQSGMGKTRLLEEYERLARAYEFDPLRISLKQQISVEECLAYIAGRLDPEKCPGYETCLESRPADVLALQDWQRKLTQKFFADLAACPLTPRVIVLFDEYNPGKTDPVKEWLKNDFLPLLFAKKTPLLVVIAGQEPIEPKTPWQGYRQFELKLPSVTHLTSYVVALQIALPPEKIERMHKSLYCTRHFVDGIEFVIAGGLL